MSNGPITYTQRLSDLSAEDPDAIALIFAALDGGERSVTRRDLLTDSLRAASLLESRGVGTETLVEVALPNSVDHVVACLAAWWLGACVLPVSPHLPPAEMQLLLESAAESGREQFLIGASPADSNVPSVSLSGFARRVDYDPTTRPMIVPSPGRAMPSGGSTGRPKVIVNLEPTVVDPDAPPHPFVGLFGGRPGQHQIVLGPMYHTGPFGTVWTGLNDGAVVVLMERFDGRRALELIEKHSVNRFFSVPAQLMRMARVDDFESFDLTSMETVYHSGAVCPPWLKRVWIERVGAERVFEGFGSTEAAGALGIRGDEWLAHPGSVGRPVVSDVSIRTPDGAESAVEEVGEIFMRFRRPENQTEEARQARFKYWGSPPARTDDDGFVSVGDLGWQDADQYVYIADRRVDMIITGGVNVFPAEVETTLSEHPDVADVAVVGVPDAEWGRRVHAVIEPRDGADIGDLVDRLDEHCRERMAPPKIPKTYAIVERLPRDENGKLRRSSLIPAEEATT